MLESKFWTMIIALFKKKKKLWVNSEVKNMKWIKKYIYSVNRIYLFWNRLFLNSAECVGKTNYIVFSTLD